MKLTITYIELRNPFLYFALTYQSLFIMLQLHKTNCVKMKNTGFGKKHYTMTFWENEADLKNFARSGAHLKYMKTSGKIAKAIKILTIDATEMPSWKEAKAMLATVKPIIY